MFSCLVAGRLPLTQGNQVDDTHLLFSIEDAQSINHISVFMTGQQPFPPGYAATVHFLWPGEGMDWQLLGCIKNSKPSAIFRLRGKAVPSSSVSSSGGSALFNSSNSNSISVLNATTAAQSVKAALGISVEPEEQVDRQINDLKFGGGNGMEMDGNNSNANPITNGSGSGSGSGNGKQPDLEMVLQIAPKIAKNAFTFLSSFAPDSAPQTAPLLSKWLENFQTKLKTRGVGILDAD